MLHIIAATRSWRRLACKSCKSCLAVALLKQTPCKLKQAAHTWTALDRVARLFRSTFKFCFTKSC